MFSFASLTSLRRYSSACIFALFNVRHVRNEEDPLSPTAKKGRATCTLHRVERWFIGPIKVIAKVVYMTRVAFFPKMSEKTSHPLHRPFLSRSVRLSARPTHRTEGRLSIPSTAPREAVARVVKICKKQVNRVQPICVSRKEYVRYRNTPRAVALSVVLAQPLRRVFPSFTLLGRFDARIGRNHRKRSQRDPSH